MPTKAKLRNSLRQLKRMMKRFEDTSRKSRTGTEKPKPENYGSNIKQYGKSRYYVDTKRRTWHYRDVSDMGFWKLYLSKPPTKFADRSECTPKFPAYMFKGKKLKGRCGCWFLSEKHGRAYRWEHLETGCCKQCKYQK